MTLTYLALAMVLLAVLYVFVGLVWLRLNRIETMINIDIALRHQKMAQDRDDTVSAVVGRPYVIRPLPDEFPIPTKKGTMN